jgi:YgiT-type zinc finger domain-containing protein
MLLKRFFKPQSHEQAMAGKPLVLDYVSLAHTGVSPEQNFSAGLMAAAIAEGWCSISKRKLILHVEPQDLIYTILRLPGRYCCHCGEKLPDDATGELARAHVAITHIGKPSPDNQNPGGYLMTNAYECVLDRTQHKKFRVKKPARAPVFWQRK